MQFFQKRCILIIIILLDLQNWEDLKNDWEKKNEKINIIRPSNRVRTMKYFMNFLIYYI